MARKGEKENSAEEERREEMTKTKEIEEERKNGDEWRVGFWNVAGVGNKDEEFWKGIAEWEVIVLIETWLMEKGWEKMRRKLPKGYNWVAQWATKKNKKGRAMGGMLMGIRDEMKGEEGGGRNEQEGVMWRKVKAGKETWSIVGVYINGDLDRKLELLRGWLEGNEGGERVIIGGDFNARTGEEGGEGREESEEERRKSKYKKQNGEGRRLTKELDEMGWEILNGNIEGDREGEYTYVGGRGATVIDYAMVGGNTRKYIKEMVVECRVESDHQPIVVTIRKGGVGKRKEEKKGKEGDEESGRRGGKSSLK